MVILLRKPYLVKWSTKGGGQKCPHGLWLTSYTETLEMCNTAMERVFCLF